MGCESIEIALLIIQLLILTFYIFKGIEIFLESRAELILERSKLKLALEQQEAID